MWSLVAVGVIGGCGSDIASEPSANPTPPTSTERTSTTTTTAADDAVPVLTGATGELIITRQRDLLDRGFINVQIVNDTGDDLLIGDRRLISTNFDTPAAPPRTSTLGDGRTVNLQVPYGTVIDCSADTPVESRLELEVDDGRRQIPLTGTDLLDQIQAEQCAQVAFDAAVEPTFGDAVVDGEVASVDVVLTPVDGAPVITIERGDGTVLVGTELVEQPVVVDKSPTTLAVVFDVNRCDPHAMAEVTKRYALDLTVSIEGGEPQRVEIDIAPIVDDLETIVANCRAANP